MMPNNQLHIYVLINKLKFIIACALFSYLSLCIILNVIQTQ